MTSKECYDIQWRNGSGSDSTNALPTSIAVIPTSIANNQPLNTRSKISQILTINGRSAKNSFYGRARIRPPSLVWEGVAGTGGVTAPASPRITAMGVATTVNATAEAIFSQQIALSAHHSEINYRSDGATPTPTSDLPEFIIRPNKHNITSSSSYHPPSLVREDSVLNSLECWDYSVELECLQGPDDLQLAAELGKTLLERNKELENSLKEQQAIIDDQAQEIEYLTKQTTTLREINDSRVKIYEQLEVSIADLEATNKQLIEESKSDKNRIKSLCANINRLDARCEELQRCLDEARFLVETSERKNKNANHISTTGLQKKLSHSESPNASRNASFSSKVNGVSDQVLKCVKTPNHYTNISEMAGDDSGEGIQTDANDRKNSDMNNDIFEKPSQVFHGYNHLVPSLNQELELKSEDSGYENGEFSEKCYITNKNESDASQTTMSSSSSSSSPAPKSSSSGSRVGSAFSDSPLESEEPISFGTDLSSYQNDVESAVVLSKKERTHGHITEHSIASFDQISGNIMHLEMDGSESKCTMNEMERVILDLKTENLRLRLDLGVRNDHDSGSLDESLQSVDEEVQEVTAVRLGKLCRRCLGINDATPGILVDTAMDLMGETLVSELQQFYGSSPSNWVQHVKSSRVWLDTWLAGLCACAFLISLLQRAFDVSSSITHDLAETWFTGNEDEEIT